MSDLEVAPVPVTRLIDDAARARPEAAAISYLGNRITYRALRSAVDSFAGSLAGLGVGPMTRVAVVLPDCPQHVVAFFAVLRLGAVVANCDPLEEIDELAVHLTNTGANVVVCLDRTAGAVLSVQESTLVRSVIATSLADGLSSFGRARIELPTPSARARRRRLVAQEPVDPAVLDYRALIRAGVPARQAPVEPVADVAVLQLTRGRELEPKTVMLSHANLVAAAHQVRHWMSDGEQGEGGDLAALPLCRVEGLTRYLLPTMLLGGSVDLVPQSAPDEAADADVGTGGGSADLYGMTETSAVAFGRPSDGPGGPGSVGRPLPGTAARIVDPEDPRKPMPVGEIGELAVSGPQVFLGYWQREADVAPPTIDGWWLTGELAVMDATGGFSIVDRDTYAVAPPGDLMRGSAP